MARFVQECEQYLKMGSVPEEDKVFRISRYLEGTARDFSGNYSTIVSLVTIVLRFVEKSDNASRALGMFGHTPKYYACGSDCVKICETSCVHDTRSKQDHTPKPARQSFNNELRELSGIPRKGPARNWEKLSRRKMFPLWKNWTHVPSVP